ncbi:MAG: glycine cleavage system protein GcvH [Chloroflexi bacterium]|nr:glycine cleavage system protein GcvH [Chloroflexota bacterium]
MASNNPRELKYSAEHEWTRLQGETATIGITHFAQDSLGDIVYLSLPAVGASVKQFQKMGEVESVKAVNDIYSPVSGKVVERNENALKSPEIINKEPFGNGWLVKVQLSDPSEMGKLLDAASYDKLTAGGH